MRKTAAFTCVALVHGGLLLFGAQALRAGALGVPEPAHQQAVSVTLFRAGYGALSQSSPPRAEAAAVASPPSKTAPESAEAAGEAPRDQTSAAVSDGAEAVAEGDARALADVTGEAAGAGPDPWAQAATVPPGVSSFVHAERVRAQAERCWDGPSAATTVSMRVVLNASGHVVERPVAIRTASPTLEASLLESRARAAIERCGPYLGAADANGPRSLTIAFEAGSPGALDLSMPDERAASRLRRAQPSA